MEQEDDPVLAAAGLPPHDLVRQRRGQRLHHDEGPGGAPGLPARLPPERCRHVQMCGDITDVVSGIEMYREYQRQLWDPDLGGKPGDDEHYQVQC